MKWKYLWFLIPLLLGVVMGWFYEFTGGKEYIGAVRYVYSLKGEARTKAVERLFGSNKNNTYNGILAGVWDNGIWVWGRWGLMYIQIEKNVSRLWYIDPCDKALLGKGVLYLNLDSWRRRVVGSHHYITVEYENKIPLRVLKTQVIVEIVTKDKGLVDVCEMQN